MRKQLLSGLMLTMTLTGFSQIPFPVKIDTSWSQKTVWMPKSPLTQQVIFVGATDTVQTTANYGNAAGRALAKQWHDFIGFTPETDPAKLSQGDLGWVSVNHEMTQRNDSIGDGGGMTVFKLRRNRGNVLEVIPQTLADGRSGKFFNVDFVNTVGETGMNCGGIFTDDGRIWTAEEWMQNSNTQIFTGFRDTADFVIGTTTPAGFPGFNGRTIKKFQNLNWFVEIDPKQGKAIRKQYNWGRAGWEGGVIMPDNKTVYMFEDGTPGILCKFVANTAGDFTTGQLYVHSEKEASKWIAIENNLDTLIALKNVAQRRGATMFTRLEWGALNKTDGNIYITETGNDNPGSAFRNGSAAFGTIPSHAVAAYKARYQAVNGMPFPGTDAAAADSVRMGLFRDYYGRVLKLDPRTGVVTTHIEGGPFSGAAASNGVSSYPDVHFSNPDGLNFAYIGNKTYMIIQEDLNGVNWNRMPAEYQTSGQIVCESFLLDMSIPNPTYSDLIRITACAPGAEITGGIALDSKTMLFNSQHPNTSNIFPYNNSLTYAISGWDGIPTSLNEYFKRDKSNAFSAYPNPVASDLHLNKVSDVAVYDATGKRVKVLRDVKVINMSDLNSGIYFIMNGEGETIKVIVE
ncbi:MAG: T9SS type A sorting domain-containing protein [Bacteroidia bacterium]